MSHEHTIKPPFADMTEAEQDQWYLGLIEKTIDQAVASGKPEEWFHALHTVKDYAWYLRK